MWHYCEIALAQYSVISLFSSLSKCAYWFVSYPLSRELGEWCGRHGWSTCWRGSELKKARLRATISTQLAAIPRFGLAPFLSWSALNCKKWVRFSSLIAALFCILALYSSIINSEENQPSCSLEHLFSSSLNIHKVSKALVKLSMGIVPGCSPGFESR